MFALNVGENSCEFYELLKKRSKSGLEFRKFVKLLTTRLVFAIFAQAVLR